MHTILDNNHFPKFFHRKEGVTVGGLSLAASYMAQVEQSFISLFCVNFTLTIKIESAPHPQKTLSYFVCSFSFLSNTLLVHKVTFRRSFFSSSFLRQPLCQKRGHLLIYLQCFAISRSHKK